MTLIVDTTRRVRPDTRPLSTAHARRVGRMAARIADRMNLGPHYVELLREAAPLHDIGKLTIPPEICGKPGPLNARERAIMRTHTKAGGRILAQCADPMLRMAATIARSHHERWDGEGYPDGVAGWEIPLCARIVSVADVFDALTHDRAYKQAWPLARAIAEIAHGAGTQFDPDIVARFVDSEAPQRRSAVRRAPTSSIARRSRSQRASSSPTSSEPRVLRL